MRYLSLCITLALSGQAISSDSFQGEWVVSPTLEVGLHQSDISSERSDLERADTVVSTRLLTDITYKSKHYDASLSHDWTNYQYSETENVSLNYQDISLANTLRLWRDDLSISASFQRYYELLDTIQGSFVDEMYSRENQILQYRRSYGLRYEFPMHNDIDMTFRHSYESNAAKSINGRTDIGDENELGQRFSAGYDLESTMLTVGQYKKRFPLYWRVDLNRRYQERRQAAAVTNYQGDATVRVPLWKEIKLAGVADYTEFQNGDAWRYSQENESLRYTVLGLGLAWVKDDGRGYVQVTHNWEEQSAEKETNYGIDASWRFADRFSLDYRHEGRFYGNSDFFNFSYSGLRHQFGVSYSESVELRFFLNARQDIEGIYVCREDDDGFFSYNEDNCFIPPSGQYDLDPGQALVPNQVLSFPLESRLTLWRETSFRWNYQWAQWEHEFVVTDVKLDDLEFNRQELGARGEFLGKWRLSSNSYIRPNWRMRSTSFTGGEFRSVENYYAVGYHHELNRAAEWSVTFQHINKNSTLENYIYDDNRITIAYQHFFGKKHKNRRSLFPSD